LRYLRWMHEGVGMLELFVGVVHRIGLQGLQG